jgi:type I restriction enzyme S subunit
LGEIAIIQIGQMPFAELLVEASAFPYVNAGTSASGYASQTNTSGETITIPSRGQGGVGIVGYQTADFWCGPLCYRIKSNQEAVKTKYLYYFLKSNQDSIRGLQQTGGTPALNRKELVQVMVAVPSPEEQERIVAILDKFDALVNDISIGLPAEIQARRQQYEHYRDRLLTFKEAA